MDYSMPPEINTFLQSVIDEAHGTNLSDKFVSDLKWNLYGRLTNHLTASYLQALPNEKADEFDAFMAGEPAQNAIQEYLGQVIPNIQEVTAKAMLEFKDTYVNAVKS